MNKKKNILFIATDLCSGGTEKVLKVILDNLNYSKYNVDLLLFVSSGYYYEKINSNVKVMSLFNTYKEYLDAYNGKTIDKTIHEKVKPIYDIHIPFAEGFSSIVASYYGDWSAKKIAWIHRDADMSKKFLLQYKQDYYNMDKIVFVSQGCLNSFVNLMGEEIRSKCIVIYNPIEIDSILAQAEEPINYKKEKPMLLAIGRLCVEKGFHSLIAAHKRLLDDGIDNKLIILGEGPDATMLRDIIFKYNLEASVHLLGFIPNPYPWIKMCDILVCSSQYESYSLVIAEGMLLQKPIVSTITVGSKELLQYKYGLLVENCEDGLYQGLKALLTTEELRDYYVNSLNDISILDKSNSMKQIEELFDELV